jgi:AcrR family transcriptional regulator
MNVPSGNQSRSARDKRGRGHPPIAGRSSPPAASKRRDAITPKRGRGRPLVDDKRRRILDAALRTFAARGYHGTAVPEVAEAAGVGTGTLYRYFDHKEALVNEVYRDAKLRLKATIMELPEPAGPTPDEAERWFGALWERLATFARVEPDAFRFLEMQDHVEYLDARSRALELSVLAPLWLTGKRLRDRRGGGPPVDVAIALLRRASSRSRSAPSPMARQSWWRQGSSTSRRTTWKGVSRISHSIALRSTAWSATSRFQAAFRATASSSPTTVAESCSV